MGTRYIALDIRYIASVDMQVGTEVINDGEPLRDGNVLIWHLRPMNVTDTNKALVNGVLMADVLRGEIAELWNGGYEL